jgi:hypothetical protein
LFPYYLVAFFAEVQNRELLNNYLLSLRQETSNIDVKEKADEKKRSET